MSELQAKPDSSLEVVNVNVIETDSGANLQHTDHEVLNQITQTDIAQQKVEEEEHTATHQELKVEIRTSSTAALLTSDQSLTTETSQDKVRAHDNQVIKPPNDTINSTATVKILLMPDGHMMTVAFSIGLTTQDLKNHFANELRVPADIIQITLDGKAVDDHETLMSLGVQPLTTVQFEMSSLDPENYPIKPVKPQQECTMPDVIAVRVQAGDETYQDVVVEIERATQKKAFLGGYCHKVTNTEYHHAAVQTMTRRRPDRGVKMFSRDTQTVEVKSQAQQCSIDTSTQMTKIGCYMSNMKDKLITPGMYFTADEYHNKRLKAVITIQTYTRRWLAQQFMAHLRQERKLRLAWMEEEERRKVEEKEKQIKAEYYRRMNPEKKEDFSLLYNALEKWRQEELENINASLCGAERKAALCALLEQETQLIASIERHRIAAGERNQEKAVQAFLDKCAASKQWRAFDGKITQMDTPNTIRAKELRDLYCSITLKDLNQEERLDVLLTLKQTVKVPQDAADLKKNIYYCRGCRNYLPSTDFALTVNSRVVGLCCRCKELDGEARQREDFSHYKTILKRLCKDEAEYNPDTKIPYLLQEPDLRYLVDVVWRAQSAQSACDDLLDLLMVRWDKHCDWSPWNCILLTKDEAAAHLKVEDIDKAYGMMFIRNIKYKHTLARKYFSQIPVMAEYLHDVKSQPTGHSSLLVTNSLSNVTK
ncbi:IQ and ubiquitin-like domain-containing protein isoform X4 [Trichomycterus rosablanca]|uniref:IQ and ubiquitin-like domain-containing protein isoform X4 n=1 Tax=Trichomycterus rosablanca TaxID=2290929 RepID=UPI002F35FCF4